MFQLVRKDFERYHF